VVVNDGDHFTTAEDIIGTAEKVFMKYKIPNDVNAGERNLMMVNLFRNRFYR
jgi:pyruvate kinase